MNYLIYIIACFLQPICWPLPEAATILLGVNSLGSTQAFVLGYIFILLGIMFMYKITIYLSNKFLSKFKKGKKFKKFESFIKNNEVLTMGILFILPILPDEVICIGSAILGIKFKIFMIVAIVAKFISIALYAFSGELSLLFNVNKFVIILLELVIIFVVAYIYNKKKEKING